MTHQGAYERREDRQRMTHKDTEDALDRGGLVSVTADPKRLKFSDFMIASKEEGGGNSSPFCFGGHDVCLGAWYHYIVQPGLKLIVILLLSMSYEVNFFR